MVPGRPEKFYALQLNKAGLLGNTFLFDATGANRSALVYFVAHPVPTRFGQKSFQPCLLVYPFLRTCFFYAANGHARQQLPFDLDG